MNDPGKIYYEQIRDIMITSKRLTVAGEFIIDLCHRVTLLMGHWNKFFSLLQQESPADTDQTTVRQVADAAVNAHFALLNNKTPKVHVAQEHAVTQYLHVHPGMMRLLMEHWVEKNHQDSARTLLSIFQSCNLVQTLQLEQDMQQTTQKSRRE